MSSLYSIKIQELKGVGVKTGQLFNKLGIYSIGQLLNYYPRAYEDWTDVACISDTVDGQLCCVKATVCSAFKVSYTSGGKILAKVNVCDDSGAMELTFFNNKYISTMLKYGKTYYFYGKISKGLFGYQMVSPTFTLENKGATIHPIYNLTSGLTNRMVSNAMNKALEMLPEKVNDPLPNEIREKYNLCDLKFALKNIHFPENNFNLEIARKRLVVEELLVLNLGLRKLKFHKRNKNNNLLHTDFSKEFTSLLLYKLTSAQTRAIAECIADMKNPDLSLNRLVQGDVGSGKTVVGASLCYSAVNNNMQVAFMAPTELLAEQHYKTFTNLFSNTELKITLLTGSVKASEKKTIRKKLANGEIDIIIGTHALITDDTTFENLGLVITDEQHRFGVSQRSKLLAKGNNPHLLVMSATPIPRTLGLIIYGDLDISIINELPPGRQEIETLLINGEKRQRAFNFIKNEIEKGRQAYIVCPLVEEGEMDLASAEEYAAELMLNYFNDIPIGILHGKMKASDKDKIMSDFANNNIKILVATTVVEVGIDVGNATIMMIENAERFGLSQLHQLRGRVGRGKEKSYCILVSDYTFGPSYERLKIMCSTRDGFKIADADLKMRGPGDFFGSRQHGLPKLNISSLADTKMVALSQEIADYVMKNSHNLLDDEYRGLNRAIKALFKNTGNDTLN